MEVGSGVGYMLQAAVRRTNPSRIIGLDVAEGMIKLAKERLARDNITDSRIEFLLYDGVTIPLPDNSIDFIYSIATIQHIPRICVYNLLVELLRVLKPSGYCSLQTFAYSHLLSLPKEIRRDFFMARFRVSFKTRNMPGFRFTRSKRFSSFSRRD